MFTFSVALERNPHIVLAHINPESFSHIDPKSENSSGVCSMWFIGLEFAKTENLNVNLTFDIQTFTKTVNRQASFSKMLKEGMDLEARHVKRKQLPQYISPSLIKRERKYSGNLVRNGADRKRLSTDNLDSKKTRLSEELQQTINVSLVNFF